MNSMTMRSFDKNEIVSEFFNQLNQNFKQKDRTVLIFLLYNYQYVFSILYSWFLENGDKAFLLDDVYSILDLK